MRTVLLTDIDDSLMSTARKHASTADLRVGASDSKGSASSFMSPRHEKLWELLRNGADIRIPVTARSQAALARVHLDFTDGAICDFGATVLTASGEMDEHWHSLMQRASEHLGQARFFERLLAEFAGYGLLKTEYRQANGISVFANFRSEAGPANATLRRAVRDALVRRDALNDYYLHMTDRDVTVLPSFVSKAAAARYLSEKEGWANDLVLALGDSLSDAGFMSQADFFIAPAKSRISTALVQCAVNQGELP